MSYTCVCWLLLALVLVVELVMTEVVMTNQFEFDVVTLHKSFDVFYVKVNIRSIHCDNFS